HVPSSYSTPPALSTLSLHDALPISEALAPLRIDAALFRHACGTHVVEQGIERNGLAGLGIDVLMVPGLGGTGGRKRQRLVNELLDRKSTRLNSSHRTISYAVFCLKK